MRDDRHELLEDIFAPEHAGNVSADEIARLIATARQVRQRRQRSAACAALFLAAAVWAPMLMPSKRPEAPRVTASVPAAPMVAVAPTPVTPPVVEHVDDEGMLAMLDDKPAALVRWPDGRQSLLLLVANPPATLK